MASRRIRKVPNRLHPDASYDPTYDLKRDIAPGVIGVPQVTAVKASGTINISGLPVAGETLTVNGVVFTFRSGTAPLATDILIGADGPATAQNAIVKLNAHTDPRVAAATYTRVGGLITAQYNKASAKGNSFTLSEAATNVAVSGATLTGGVTNRYSGVVETFIE